MLFYRCYNDVILEVLCCYFRDVMMIFIGVMMMPSVVLAYNQLGQFLMIVMVMSWFYGTFIFLAMCSVIGPRNNFGQLSITRFCRSVGCKVRPEKEEIDSLPKEKEDSSNQVSKLPANSTDSVPEENNKGSENVEDIILC